MTRICITGTGESWDLEEGKSPLAPSCADLESGLNDICFTAGYFGAWRERVRHLAKALDLEYSGELVSGVTTILVVAESQGKSCAELLLELKARTAMQWGDIDIVRHQWLEDSAQHGALCDLEAYTLVPKKVWYFTPLRSSQHACANRH